MAFTGHEDHSVTLADASKWTKNFRDTIVKGDKIGGYFSRDAIEKVLAQESAVGIRYYYGLNDEKQPVLIISGVDAKGDDLYNGILIERSVPCPTQCSTANPLNS